MASAGCRKTAGLPIEVMVAAIVRPIGPDVPMPVTTTWPLQWKRISTAFSNCWLIFPRAFRIALASVSKTFFPVSILPINAHYTIFADGLKGGGGLLKAGNWFHPTGLGRVGGGFLRIYHRPQSQCRR